MAALSLLLTLTPGDAFAQALAPPVAAEPVAKADAANQKVLEIRVEGSKRVENTAISRVLHTKLGQPFDPARTPEDLRAVWALNYFTDVQLLVQRLPKGIAYVVRVEERPAVREVKLEGNQELSKDDFKDVIDLKPFSILDQEVVARNLKKIQDKYVEKGFFLAEVTSRLDPVGDQKAQVDVVYVIHEHAKVLVKEIKFIGNDKVASGDLRGVMNTKEGNFLSFITNEGTYKDELFQRDLVMIQAAYYDRGFINVKVEKPSVSMSPDKRFIFIAIKVEEGDPYKIGLLDFSGDLLVDKEILHKKMVSHEGDFFNRSKLSTDIAALSDVYYDRGYAYANIAPQTRVHPEDKTVDLIFDVQKGKQVYIERIDISGNSKTRDRVIRREMRIYEGELFNGTALRRSKERVTALGFFETVEIVQKPGTDDAHINLQVEVKEKSTGTFQVGFGLSSVETYIFTAQVSQNNLLGWGPTASVSAQLSALRQLLQLSYFDAYFLDTDLIFSVNLYRTQAVRYDFIRDSLGGDVTLGYHILEDVMLNLTYTLESVRVEPAQNSETVLLADRFRNGVNSVLRLSATWDKRDNRLFPTKGFMEFASVEVGPQWLGSTFKFARYTANSRFYVPMPLGMVFKGNINVGYIQALDPSSPLPISELYLIGGINSLRGFPLASVSPRSLVPSTARADSNLVPFVTGGDKEFIMNLELEFPIVQSVGIRGVIFYDVGNAFAPNASFFQDREYNLPLGLLMSVGFGVRWFSPVGPLRFEWGFPLTRRPGIDQPVQFEFTIGNFF